jgi:hypothetical protein
VDDPAFISAFEAAAIASERWMHRDHVRMAFLYLRDHSFGPALARIRSGILALNRANGGRNTATSGYHETLTVAWALLIADAIDQCRAQEQAHALADSESFLTAHPQLLAKGALRAHYSSDRITSIEARVAFVQPDLAALPASHAVHESGVLTDPLEPLILDLLEWLAPAPRPYSEVMAAWRTSCPRLPVWEETTMRGLLERDHTSDGTAIVSITDLGHALLAHARH